MLFRYACDRPQVIKQLDYGLRGVISPFTVYSNEKLENTDNGILPVVMDNEKPRDSEIEDLRQQGWMFPGELGLNKPWQPL